MANFTPSTSNTVTAANAGTSQNSGTAVFIPELWSDEIIAAYEKNLVLANLVNRMPMTGKKGDTLYIPSADRGSASVVVPDASVVSVSAIFCVCSVRTLAVSAYRHGTPPLIMTGSRQNYSGYFKNCQVVFILLMLTLGFGITRIQPHTIGHIQCHS